MSNTKHTHLHVSFGPVDALNPESGYSVRIIGERGDVLLFTGRAPDTGADLLTPADCLRVISMYAVQS